MNIKQVADELNGRSYTDEMTKEYELQLKENGIVVLFGASDDLAEFRGAINDEVDCYEGGIIKIDTNGIPKNKCSNDSCPHFAKKIFEMKEIEVIWGKENIAWTYKTEIPHKTFNILEDTCEDDVYCRGIVFMLSDA